MEKWVLLVFTLLLVSPVFACVERVEFAYIPKAIVWTEVDITAVITPTSNCNLDEIRFVSSDLIAEPESYYDVMITTDGITKTFTIRSDVPGNFPYHIEIYRDTENWSSEERSYEFFESNLFTIYSPISVALHPNQTDSLIIDIKSDYSYLVAASYRLVYDTGKTTMIGDAEGVLFFDPNETKSLSWTITSFENDDLIFYLGDGYVPIDLATCEPGEVTCEGQCYTGGFCCDNVWSASSCSNQGGDGNGGGGDSGGGVTDWDVETNGTMSEIVPRKLTKIGEEPTTSTILTTSTTVNIPYLDEKTYPSYVIVASIVIVIIIIIYIIKKRRRFI